MFQNEVYYFLDSELSPDGIATFHKNISVGVYVHFTGFVP